LIAASGLLSFKLGKRRARSQLENNEPLRSMPIYHGLYVSLWTILPPIFLLILFLIFKNNILDYLITPFISASTISMGLDEVIYVKNSLMNNISNLNNLIDSDFLSKEMAYSLYGKYSLGRLVIFGSLVILSIIFSFLTFKKLSVRFDARRRVESIFKFIFFLFSLWLF